MAHRRINKNNKTLIAFSSTIIILLTITSAILFQNFYSIKFVNGTSMEPTLQNGDVVILKKDKNLKKNQIAFFPMDKRWTAGTHLSNDEILVKRVVAVSGDTFEYKNRTFYINGDKLYNLPEDYKCITKSYKKIISKDEFFAMGDNAEHSFDSRKVFCSGKIEESFAKTSTILSQGKIIFKI